MQPPNDEVSDGRGGFQKGAKSWTAKRGCESTAGFDSEVDQKDWIWEGGEWTPLFYFVEVTYFSTLLL